MDFLELRRDSRVTTGNSGCLLCWPRQVQSSIRVAKAPANARDMSSIPESGGSPGGGNGNPLQYSCLENSMDRGAWRATVHGVAKSQT